MSSSFVFVDQAIDQYQFLANGIDPTATVVVLDSQQDGVAQISAVLAAQASIEAVHLFSHGAPGTLQLGATTLTLDSLAAYDLAPWQQALRHANLLIYGCRVASGAVGDRFLQELHQRTGANIAATVTPTGSAAQGGDWNLEWRIGAIEPVPILHPDVMAQYDSTLEFVIPNLLFAPATTDEGNVAQPSQLRVVDLETGDSQIIAPLAFQTFALARQAGTGRLYYVETGENGRVAYYDTRTGQNVTLLNRTGVFDDAGAGAPPSQFVKLAQQAGSGIIYAMNSSTPNLFSIAVEGDTAGIATNLGAITLANGDPLPFGGGDIAFDPENPNRLFVTVTRPDSSTNVFQLYTVDVSAPGLPATFVGDVRLPNGIVLSDAGSGSLAFGQDGFLYLTSDIGEITASSRLFQVDPDTGIVVDADRVRPIARLNDFATLPTVTPQVDLVLTKTDGLDSIQPGEEIVYTITVTNTSPTGSLADIRLTDFITGVNGVTWSGVFTGGIPGDLNSFFPGAEIGTGDIDVRFNLAAQATLTYTVRGTVDPDALIGTTLENTAQVIVPPGVIDPNPEDNTDSDQTDIGCVRGINRRGRNNRDNRLLGDNDINRLTGGGRRDVLRGFGCPDTLIGNRGRDLLRGGNARDNLQGNQNNDRLNGGEGRDRLNGGLGNDTLLGSIGNDSLRGGSGRDRLLGGAGADRMVGNNGDDVMRGNRENDVMFGRLDNDRLNGNRGNDRLRGNLGRDRLGGGAGSDLVEGGRGNDVLFGGNGNDRLNGDLGLDVLVAGNGDDSLLGRAQADRLFGGAGRDQIIAGGGADRVEGGAQADVLNGGLGIDRIIGGGGADRLIGGRRTDALRGGGGRDRFEYRNTDEGGDRVLDFASAADQIDLSRIFARSGYGGERPFRQYVRLQQSGSDTLVLLDVNGDRSSGFETFITLAGVNRSSMSARNFIV
ncbi:DUF4347 domain-containing protein [Microcoleus sp. FACHB-1515]|uniref:DUF4347 domain-containing protein n=1 Tax=Cyanophyceae TaxID=3028117 RepID=UPI001682B0BD|nr:DUF4347 domain-containing protein [Microcoleus sp. FACHB-1515]MBD2090878.1 DUF4347 domain-containing protein [Microcoleus sp. FACHB-1515]